MILNLYITIATYIYFDAILKEKYIITVYITKEPRIVKAKVFSVNENKLKKTNKHEAFTMLYRSTFINNFLNNQK